LACGSADGSITIRNRAAGYERVTSTKHAGPGMAMAYGPVKDALCSTDGTELFIWDLGHQTYLFKETIPRPQLQPGIGGKKLKAPPKPASARSGEGSTMQKVILVSSAKASADRNNVLKPENHYPQEVSGAPTVSQAMPAATIQSP